MRDPLSTTKRRFKLGLILLLCPVILNLPGGCRRIPAPGRPPGQLLRESGPAATAEGHQASCSASLASESGVDNRTPDLAKAAWLTVKNLADFLPSLQQRATRAGYVAACIQPDPGQRQTFLVVAEDPAAARQLNGFFYWLSDMAVRQQGREKGQETDPARLFLCLDRLFSEAARPAAMAGGLYSDPAVVSLLEQSLRLILADEYQPAVLEYLLACYRRDFRRRLSGRQPAGQVEKKIFQHLEVNYETAIFSSITFRILPS